MVLVGGGEGPDMVEGVPQREVVCISVASGVAVDMDHFQADPDVWVAAAWKGNEREAAVDLYHGSHGQLLLLLLPLSVVIPMSCLLKISPLGVAEAVLRGTVVVEESFLLLPFHIVPSCKDQALQPVLGVVRDAHRSLEEG